ncbi:uncharacterized protein LY89DRAFT_728126 [Mollisia scopiformis]|uniref:Uncharacterized protein n=1 Tax=Mollisia scopiformis TaxID=149040 RepID=A0A194XT44_MOLSC|nr:uncharacterized protein LY89DRAFT_728126 [Mollisia scopiformis]KUJ23373.1 hypothetical protein LY89DRAFT_728126 [Mollisia scopiformis]
MQHCSNCAPSPPNLHWVYKSGSKAAGNLTAKEDPKKAADTIPSKKENEQLAARDNKAVNYSKALLEHGDTLVIIRYPNEAKVYDATSFEIRDKHRVHSKKLLATGSSKFKHILEDEWQMSRRLAGACLESAQPKQCIASWAIHERSTSPSPKPKYCTSVITITTMGRQGKKKGGEKKDTRKANRTRTDDEKLVNQRVSRAARALPGYESASKKQQERMRDWFGYYGKPGPSHFSAPSQGAAAVAVGGGIAPAGFFAPPPPPHHLPRRGVEEEEDDDDEEENGDDEEEIGDEVGEDGRGEWRALLLSLHGAARGTGGRWEEPLAEAVRANFPEIDPALL